MTRLAGRIAVVTGSTSGIGKGIALHFASLGARVVVHGRDIDAARQVVADIAAGGAEADVINGDLADPAACTAVVEFAVKRFGGLDILVNNAASTARGSVESTTLEFWDRMMAINLRAPFLCMQAAVRHMKERQGGSIVNIGSVNAYVGHPNLHAYSVSKGGLMTLTKNAAAGLGQYRIRVNQINVGWTLTEGEHRVQRSEGKPDNWADEVVKSRPFGRMLLPIDIAHAAAYFASDESACVSGVVMDLEQYPVGAPGTW